MGLQCEPIMSAVPARDIVKSAASRRSSAKSAASFKNHSSSGALHNIFEAAHLKVIEGTDRTGNKEDDINRHIDNSFLESAENIVESVRNIADETAPRSPREDGEWDWEWESEEDRLLRSLGSWMPHYRVLALPRPPHTPREPVFSAILGRDRPRTLQPASSSESLHTQLSLFSCSTYGSRKTFKKRRRLKRRKPVPAEKPQPQCHVESRWVQLARCRKGELDRFMMAQAHALTQGFNLTDESEAFLLCDEDEQRALFLCGQRHKLHFARRGLTKAPSMTNVPHSAAPRPRPRAQSADAHLVYGEPIDFQELHRQTKIQKLMSQEHRRHSRGRSLQRSHSITSLGSGNDVFFSVRAPGGCSSPVVPMLHPPSSAPEAREEGSRMWQGDTQIMAIDLKKELSQKVKKRIAVTTSALERVTGMGDNNQPRPYSCHLREFPNFVDNDYALRPKIAQKIRISPHLSKVIQSDIRVRMGRPRYHEIRVRDLEIWNRGQTLDRAHRNLKVFNWLHSLKDDDVTLLQQTTDGVPPDLNDITLENVVLVRAVDDPDIKPLYLQKKTWIR